MNSRKSDQECAAFLYEAMETGQRYSRSQLLAMATLTADEFCRARKFLANAGLLNVEPTRCKTRAAYTLSEKLWSTNWLSVPPVGGGQFAQLLQAWDIQLPLRDTVFGARTVHRFGVDERPSDTAKATEQTLRAALLGPTSSF